MAPKTYWQDFVPDSVNRCRTLITVLLMDCVIDFRIGDKHRLESLDELIMQEKEWLSHFCARILNRKPSIIFTSKPVSGYARQLFFESGTVELVMNVKTSALERLAHATGADIVMNMEELKAAGLHFTYLREILVH